MKKNKKNLYIYIILLILVILLSILLKDDILEISNSIYNSFYRTVLEENRYILLLEGTIATLQISLLSCFFGTLLAFGICYIRKSENKYLYIIGKVYVNVIQGIPITVLLLVFYYIIFGKIDIDPLIVAVITFSLYFSAYIAEIFRGALNSINISQVQSSFSLGFNKIQTLKYIILPQALCYIIPVYKNETVTLIKLTSIAGYISIMDLTKASDIIRNRTYEAFFPLIVISIIYFIICYVVGKLLDGFYKKINSRYKKESCYVKN